MKPLAFLCLLALCTACAPQGLPPTGAAPTLTATRRPAPTSPPVPTPTPTRLLPSPVPVFGATMDNVAVDQQGQVYAGGYDEHDDLRHFARWDGSGWIELAQGFKTAGSALAVDSAGHLYTEMLMEAQPNHCAAVMMWATAK